jgi:ubiquinone/menaquinone biosynthesis C-methylase UbiE
MTHARTVETDLHRDQARMVAERTPPGGRILEVGRGAGHTAIEVAKTGVYEVAVLDVGTASVASVEIAQANAREAGISAAFCSGDAAALPYADGSFDVVFCSGTFKGFPEPVEALREFRRVLKPGGRVLVVDLRGGVSTGTAGRASTRYIPAWVRPRRAYTKAQFAELFAKADVVAYEIVETPNSLVIDIVA